MDENITTQSHGKPVSGTWRQRFHRFVHEFKTLQGDPNYIAKGIAIGVFIGITPTIPLHTGLAVALAFLFKASKPAAVIGVWAGNPVTVPFLYMGSYKIGVLLLGNTDVLDKSYFTIQGLLHHGIKTTVAMILGGMILGILPAIAAYVISLKLFTAIRTKKESKETAK